VEQAIRRHVRRNRRRAQRLRLHPRHVLLLQWPDDLDEDAREEHALFVMKFQQLTGPVMAKGVEDTSFYIYNRLVSLNEVGGEPRAVSDSSRALPSLDLMARLQNWPRR
jgi:(1->4)-alpha-D-glucan 1-alpha-D-glucosylmutase